MSEKQEERKGGITVKELKAFLAKLPESFDTFTMVNGEVAGVDVYYVRLDKPVLHLEMDEKSGEFLILHQSEEELNKILDEIDGASEGPKE